MSLCSNIFINENEIKRTNIGMMTALTLQDEGKLYEKVKQYPVLFDKQHK